MNAAGVWTCVPSTPLPDGSTLSAVQTDPSGNPSTPSPPVTVTIDDVPPARPAPDASDGTVLTGTAGPGTTVIIRDSGGAPVCVTIAGADGRFTCTPSRPVPPGTLLLITSTDAAGNPSESSMVRAGGPTVTVDLTTAQPGDTQVARGRGFLPGEQVEGLLESTPIGLGPLTADATGAVTFTIPLPSDLDIGMHRLTLTGEQSGDASTQFEVVPPTDPVSAPPAHPTGGIEQVGAPDPRAVGARDRTDADLSPESSR